MDTATITDEVAQVHAWRTEILIRCGLDPLAAYFALQDGVDPYALRRLVDLGCPLDLALEIVV